MTRAASTITPLAAASGAFFLLASSTGAGALHVAPSPALPPRDPRRSLPISPSAPPQCSEARPNALHFSALFGAERRHGNNRRRCGALRASTPNGSNAVDAEITGKSSSSGTAASSTSFLQAVDNFGMKLKPWALNAYDRSLEHYPKVNGTDANATNATTSGGNVYENRARSLLCKCQANVLWVLYIFYRGYRGFFVILPAVFREVYRKLEESDVVVDVYGDDDDEREIAEKQPPLRLRTRITISVLSMMLTLSYVVSGALRVLGKFIRTFTNTTSVESSFEAAAEEVGANEDKLRSKLK